MAKKIMAKTGRMEFRVDDNFVSTVNDLAERTHKSKAEVLRDAINLYYKAVNEWEKNGRGIVFQKIDNKSKIATNKAEEACFA
jgi:predicted transcriptional regulator